mgnify:CR=1 FL=1
MTMKSRIVTKELANGKKEVTVLDPHSGRVVAQYEAGKNRIDADVRNMKAALDRKGHQTDVIEH